MRKYFIYNKKTQIVDVVVNVNEDVYPLFNPFDYCDDGQAWCGETNNGSVCCDDSTTFVELR